MYEAPRCDTPPPGGFIPLARSDRFSFVPPRAVAGSECSSPFLAVGEAGPPKACRGSVATSDPATGSPITNLSANSLTSGVPPARAKPQGFGPPPSKFHNNDAMPAKPGQVLRAPFGILSTFPQSHVPPGGPSQPPHPPPRTRTPPLPTSPPAGRIPDETDSQISSHSVTEMSYFAPA